MLSISGVLLQSTYEVRGCGHNAGVKGSTRRRVASTAAEAAAAAAASVQLA